MFFIKHEHPQYTRDSIETSSQKLIIFKFSLYANYMLQKPMYLRPCNVLASSTFPQDEHRGG